VDLNLPAVDIRVGGFAKQAQQQSEPVIEAAIRAVAISPESSTAASSEEHSVRRTSALPSSDLYNSIGSLRCRGRLLTLAWKDFVPLDGTGDSGLPLVGMIRTDTTELEALPGLDIVIVLSSKDRLIDVQSHELTEDEYTTAHSCVLMGRCGLLKDRLVGLLNDFRTTRQQLSFSSSSQAYLPVIHASDLLASGWPVGVRSSACDGCTAVDTQIDMSWWQYIFDYLYNDVPQHQRHNISGYWAGRELYERRNQKLLTSLSTNTICGNSSMAEVAPSKRSEMLSTIQTKPAVTSSGSASESGSSNGVAVHIHSIGGSEEDSDQVTSVKHCSIRNTGTGQLEFDCKYFGINIYTARLVCLKGLLSGGNGNGSFWSDDNGIDALKKLYVTDSGSGMSLGKAPAHLNENEIVEDETLWRTGPLVHRLIEIIAQV
jgi:hypothetical protein